MMAVDGGHIEVRGVVVTLAGDLFVIDEAVKITTAAT
jgi:hypothetical protein